ncbi:(R,S)-reticuline 7-O-methyltransferase [Morella rubra]|uniref:(R,S)-reticuline 7-O-methyltransferase n=1 Tax=Morella rubra TaxID=262757 RepID=A0A6A1V039_9ROSI|nr:(R,S)-reticuline 7-O-methyltransferase [Morella rubra]
MALKCAVELRLADIIHSHNGPIILHQIASGIDSPSPDILYLSRIMRSLVRKKIFSEHCPTDGGETIYELTHVSRWLLHDVELSLAPMVLMQNHPWVVAPWYYLSQCVKEGGIAFKKAHACDVWEFASQNPEFNKLVNDSMACTTKIVMMAILAEYKAGFDCIGSLVDVGGGTGGMISEIVRSHPQIRGIDFDLPHVIATAPLHEGVSHVGGNMFEAIPCADAIFMKFVLHDWDHEDCIKILRNCRKAILEKTGKLIIVDIVLEKDSHDLFDDTRMVFDLMMMAHSSGGKELTELEWKEFLKGGFPGYKITKIPAIPFIIEAYPM